MKKQTQQPNQVTESSQVPRTTIIACTSQLDSANFERLAKVIEHLPTKPPIDPVGTNNDFASLAPVTFSNQQVPMKLADKAFSAIDRQNTMSLKSSNGENPK